MALVRFDAAGGGEGQSGWDHTVAFGAPLLVVWVWYGSAGSVTATYNGISMTRLLDAVNYFSVFVLVNPTPGTHAIALNVTADAVFSGSFFGAASISSIVTAYLYGNFTLVTPTAKNERSMLLDGEIGSASGPYAGQTARGLGGVTASTKPAPAEAWNTPVSKQWYLTSGMWYYALGMSVDAPDEGAPIGMTPILMH